jgi:hypothetical protein
MAGILERDDLAAARHNRFIKRSFPAAPGCHQGRLDF